MYCTFIFITKVKGILDMKMIFIDAENIGLKEIEKAETCIIDKVFVFSKVESIKRSCEKLLYLCLSDYPDGANQADFYIIAYLSRILITLPKQQINTIEFELCTNDKNLISAFEFQCNLLRGKCTIIRTKKPSKELISLELENIKQQSPNSTQLINELSINASNKTLNHLIDSYPNECKPLVKALQTPQKLNDDLRQKLHLSKSTFTKIINELRCKNRIKRTTKDKSFWELC